MQYLHVSHRSAYPCLLNQFPLDTCLVQYFFLYKEVPKIYCFNIFEDFLFSTLCC
uniref:Uncharacterized protein n=1 Tax=Rhizophora mucronata TaxID=61149 RepID=A0A2P2PDW9_RHIMU